MPPQARRSTSRPSAQPNIDPTVFGALSIADLCSLCVQHGIPSTGVRKTLERRLRELNNPPPTQVQNINEHEIEIMTMETQSQVPLIESENTTCPLPTPINLRRLEETLTNHPDQEFISKLCNNLRYGADVGFNGRRVARFSRNLPTPFPNQILFQKTFPGKWPWGELWVLSPAHHCPISRCPSSDWSPKNILLSLGPSFTYLSQNPERRVSTLQSPRRISAFSI